MKNLSTKKKLIILGIITTFSIFILSASTKILNDRETRFISLRQEVLGIHEYMLDIKNQTNNFSLTKQTRYVKFTYQRLEKLYKFLDDLEKRAKIENIHIENSKKIRYLLKLYENLFNELYLIEDEIGFTKYTGLRGEMRSSILKVERSFRDTHNITMQKKILTLRRNEKNFLLRKNILYAYEHQDNFKKTVDYMKKKKFTSALPALIEYQEKFMQIVYNYKEKGIDNNSIMYKELTDITNLVDHQIELITKQFDSKIQQHIQNTFILYIIILSMIIFIIILSNILIIRNVIKEIKATQTQLIQSEKMASLGSLVAGVAHEINTPIGISLTGISHVRDLAKNLIKKYKNEDLSESEFESSLENINEATSSSLLSINKAAELIKSFKRVSIDQTSEEAREFLLKDYTNELILSLRNIIKKTKIDIHVEIPENLKIMSIPGSYGQIITNLIMNSLLHGFEPTEEGKILIKIKKIRNNYLLTYKDNGRGISPKLINKIFDPFVTTARTKGGSGLGLNILYNIVTVTLKGSVTCTSEEGKGVEFKILIPIHTT